MRYKLAVALVGVILGGLAFGSVNYGVEAQDVTPSLILPSSMQSVFGEDICAPPCWYGLTSGVSTSAEVKALFQTHLDWFGDEKLLEARGKIDAQTGLVTNGLYTFYLRLHDYYFVPTSNRIYIRDGIVYRLSIWMNQTVTLGQTLNALGMPDFIHYVPNASPVYPRSQPTMDLIYLKPRLRISFTNIDQHKACFIESIRQDMGIYKVRYYSPEAADEVNKYTSFASPYQSALTAFEHLEQNLPLEEWQEWLQGKVRSNCASVQLPPMPSVQDLAPSLTIAEPVSPQSLFVEDSCNPPCWFGLSVKQSTGFDVSDLIQSPSHVFDINFVSDGTYFLNWADFPRDDYDFPNGALGIAIALKSGIVDQIHVTMNRIVFLRDVLDSLGMPDHMTFSKIDDPELRAEAYLTLIYSDLQIAVYLKTDQFNCDFVSLGEQFGVEDVVYYSSEDAGKFLQDENIPSEVWQAWLKSNCFTE